MKSAMSMILLSIALAATLGGSTAVRADEGPSPGAVGFGLGGSSVDTGVLDEQRGGADTSYLNEIHAVGSVSEVQASDLVTGSNIVTEGSLAGASGMPMLIQNTGNGVLIQNAVIVNVEVK